MLSIYLLNWFILFVLLCVKKSVVKPKTNGRRFAPTRQVAVMCQSTNWLEVILLKITDFS